DPRVSKVGRLLRRTSLDELPQLFNVLRGEMSLVGPRPIVRDELARYGDDAQYYLMVRPGITGLWQVSGRNDVDYEQRVYLDTWYVKNWSLWYDIAILFKTLRVVLRRQGAY
ncbi:MAG: UDP-phosphate galactose phosphotransferase, partial [Burkholderiales bacterium]